MIVGWPNCSETAEWGTIRDERARRWPAARSRSGRSNGARPSRPLWEPMGAGVYISPMRPITPTGRPPSWMTPAGSSCPSPARCIRPIIWDAGYSDVRELRRRTPADQHQLETAHGVAERFRGGFGAVPVVRREPFEPEYPPVGGQSRWRGNQWSDDRLAFTERRLSGRSVHRTRPVQAGRLSGLPAGMERCAERASAQLRWRGE